MNIILLTHEKENSRKTGTGKLVKKVLDKECKIITWSRVEPDKHITEEIDKNKTLLIYPGESESNTDFNDIENFILLDGTWQEARKIYNKSDYLKEFNKFEISQSDKSIFHKRKNQIEGGLCTAESVINILRLKGKSQKADILEDRLKEFLNS